MRLIIKGALATLLLVISIQASAQDALRADEEYSTEGVFGIVKATNGGLISGVYYRHSRKLSKDNLMHLSIEFANVKHPRETRETTFTGSSYVFGKANYLFSFRPQYGREKIFFKKAPQQGVRISGLVAAGPSIGLEVPYFVDLGTRTEQFDPENPFHSRAFIVGNAGPFRGLFQSQVVLGVFFKGALTFETNSTKNRVFGVEAGFTVEAFTRNIEIVPTASASSTFAAAYLAIYFGKRR